MTARMNIFKNVSSIFSRAKRFNPSLTMIQRSFNLDEHHFSPHKKSSIGELNDMVIKEYCTEVVDFPKLTTLIDDYNLKLRQLHHSNGSININLTKPTDMSIIEWSAVHDLRKIDEEGTDAFLRVMRDGRGWVDPNMQKYIASVHTATEIPK